MSAGEGFAVDVPVTNLNTQDIDDDFVSEASSRLGSAGDMYFDEDNVSLQLNELDERSMASKVASSMKRLFNFGTKKQFGYLGDTIELYNRNRSNSSFADGDDPDIHRFMFDDNGEEYRQKKRYKKMVSTLTLGLGLTTLLLIAYIIHVKTSLPIVGSNKDKAQPPSYDGILSTSTHMNNNPKTILSNGTHDFYPTTIMISLDGFHPHYISPVLTPFLHNLMVASYGAPYMIPSFPSSTFPNHWTLVTGLYPNDHGIVGNTFFDESTHSQFINVKQDLSLKSDWWGGQPIWQTAYYQNVSTGVHMWPGSEVVFPEGNPMEVDKYNGTEVLSAKVDRLLSWLDRDIQSRPELMLSYVPTIDSLGHKYGVEGEELSKGLTYVDNFIESLFLGIYERNLNELVNVIIVSDHGMAPTSNDRLIYLDDMIDISKIEHMDGWPLFGLRPYKNQKVNDVYEELVAKYEDHPMKENFQVFLKEDLPEEWKFGGKYTNQYSSRIAPIWVIPNVGYSVTTHADMKKKNGVYSPHGVHGYNNTELLMRAIFIGSGPYFSEKLGTTNTKVKPFYNTEVYNIVCDSLSLIPSASNATLLDGSYINSKNSLPEEWLDELSYPDVSFPIELLHQNATYDLLYRLQGSLELGPVIMSLDMGAATSVLGDEEKEMVTTSTDEYAPDPTYFQSLELEATSTTTLATSFTTGIAKPNDGEDEVDDDDHEDDDEDNKSKGKGKTFMEELQDVYDDLEDFVDDTIDDIEDMMDTVKEKVKGDNDD